MSFHWIDNEREELETKAIGDKRELMAHVFYPCDPSATGERAVYLPDADALRGEWSDAILARSKVMRAFSNENAPVASGAARCPVAIFSPGGGMKTLMYHALIEDLAFSMRACALPSTLMAPWWRGSKWAARGPSCT